MIRLRSVWSALLTVVAVCPAQTRQPEPLFPGICFGPFRIGEAPGGLAPLPSALRADLLTVRRVAPRVRVYGLGGTGILVPELCEEVGLKCWAGAWIGRDPLANQLETELLVHVARRLPATVETVLVGNEVLLRGDQDEAGLAAHLTGVRDALRAAGCKVPVGTAEPWSVWVERLEFARRHCDVVVVHVHPYWDRVAVEDAARHTVDKLELVRERLDDPKIRVVLGEFGWPTGGEANGAARPGRAEAARYYRDLLPRLKRLREPWFPFEMWDEAWKASDEGSVGPHWGLFEASGAPKPELREVIDGLGAAESERPARGR